MVNNKFVHSEVVHSIHDSVESAEMEARELEHQLPLEFEVEVESFKIKTVEDYEDYEE